MRKNAHKENIIFEKNRKNNLISFSIIDPLNVIEDIEKIKENKENVYFFESGNKADFLYKRSCVNDLSFNYFQIYNKKIALCLNEISKEIKQFSKQSDTNTEKTHYYISSEYEEEFLEDFWYDTGGISSPSYSGYWFLKTNNKASITVNEVKYDVGEGSLAVFEAASKTLFSGIERGISFNVSTLSKIEGQYPQKWMPLILV
jgi:hypothetical protein